MKESSSVDERKTVVRFDRSLNSQSRARISILLVVVVSRRAAAVFLLMNGFALTVGVDERVALMSRFCLNSLKT